jgi:hypothetical protein
MFGPTSTKKTLHMRLAWKERWKMTKHYRVDYYVKLHFDVEVEEEEVKSKERLAADKAAKREMKKIQLTLLPWWTGETCLDNIEALD